MNGFRKLNVMYCHGLGSSINNRHGTQLKQYFEKYSDVYFERILYNNPGSINHVWNVNEWRRDIEQRIDGNKWVIMATSGACHAALNIANEKPSVVQGLFLFCPGTSLDIDFVNTIAPGALKKLISEGSLIYPPSRNGHPALINMKCLEEFLETCISKKGDPLSIKCPVLVCHGTDDNLVPYSNSVKLVERLKSNSINSELITLKAANHYFDINEEIRNKLDEFMEGIRRSEKSKI